MTAIHRHAVFGHPVAHSLSPRIHAEFGRQTGIALTYDAIDAAPADFADAVDAFARASGLGANVTLPHKQAAFALCTQVSDRAQRAGAVNTLIRVGDAWHGDVTDGVGLVRDLTGRHMLDLRGRRMLLLGAGGAARGVLPALLDAGVGQACVVNRTRPRADELVSALQVGGRVQAHDAGTLGALGSFDLILNATSAVRGTGLPPLPASLVDARTTCVDLGYGGAATAFLDWAGAAGARGRIDGLGMLVEQAAESFACWHGLRPDTTAIYTRLRLEMGA